MHALLRALLAGFVLLAMAFDMGFDFRGSDAFVTDPPYGTPVSSTNGFTYPHTFTTGNGDTINAGWVVNPDGHTNRDAGIDARLAGLAYRANTGTARTFQVDLASGSGPGATGLSVALALGDAGSYGETAVIVDDNGTPFITISKTATASGHFLDATGVDYSAANWPGSNTPVAHTFSSTTCNLILGANDASGDNSRLAHFRLTLPADVLFAQAIM